VARRRWPATAGGLLSLAAADVGAALLFLWAQLAAVGEVAHALGGAPAAAVGAAGLVLAALTWGGAGGRVAGAAAAAGLLGLALALVVVTAVTTPWWPRVWSEVASRSRRAVSGDGAWTTAGRPVRGTGATAILTFREDHRVTLLGRGRVRVDLWEGGEARRDVTADTELMLRAGDRLAVPDGFALRFQAGRRIPGAPATGSDWVEPLGPRPGGPSLVGLAVTVLLGAVGLPVAHVAFPTGAARERAGRGAASVVVLGALLVTLWVLYAIWLTPEIYTAGVAPAEVYELAGHLLTLGSAAGVLRLAALWALVSLGMAAGLSALASLPRDLARLGPPPLPALGVVAVASALAAATPARPWPVLLAAFGLAASVGAPGAVLTCWAERVTARGVTAGATLGLVAFGGLSLVGLTLGVGVDRPLEGSWLRWLATWPALAALPANALTAWLVGTRPAASPRSPLSPGLADLHA
jgi:hypothetical protein